MAHLAYCHYRQTYQRVGLLIFSQCKPCSRSTNNVLDHGSSATKPVALIVLRRIEQASASMAMSQSAFVRLKLQQRVLELYLGHCRPHP